MNDKAQGNVREAAFELRSVTRRFEETVALD